MKFVLVVPLPLSKVIGERIDLWWFARNGFDAELWEISGLFLPKEKLEQYFGGADDYRYMGPNLRIFISRAEVEREVRDLGQGDVVWYMRFGKNYMVDDDWLIHELQNKQARYYLTRIVPSVEPVSFAAKLYYYLAGQKQRFLNRQFHPDGVIGCGRKGREQAKRMYPYAKFVSVPSIFVCWHQSAPIVDGPYILFVDESIGYEPDSKLLGQSSCLNPEAYYERLNRLFKMLEEWSGSPVVIAASGKYIYPIDRFEGRRLIYGQTLPLIQNARLVLGHVSMALNQCIASLKPTIILDDPDFTDVKRRGFSATLMRFVAKPIGVMDVTEAMYRSTLHPPQDVMERVINDYLREDGVEGDYYSILKGELLQGREAS